MTDEEIESGEVVCQNASPGPWTSGNTGYRYFGDDDGVAFARVQFPETEARRRMNEYSDSCVKEGTVVGMWSREPGKSLSDEVRNEGGVVAEGDHCDADAEFVRHAREAYPKALAEVRRQRAQIAELEARLAEAKRELENGYRRRAMSAMRDESEESRT